MNLMILTYWSYKEPLIQNYTIPYLGFITKHSKFHNVYFVTFEKDDFALSDREKTEAHELLAQYNIELVQFKYKPFRFNNLGQKYRDYRKLYKFCKGHSITTIHAWGSISGGIGYLIAKKLKCKLILDSFEPHAESMVETNTWRKNSIVFRLLFRLEKKQVLYADYTIGVVSSMVEYSKEKYGVTPKNFHAKPACIDKEAFKFNPDFRKDVREELNLGNKVVGVYVGKIGGIYLEEEIFNIINECEKFWGSDNFHFIFITMASEEDTQKVIKESEYSGCNLTIKTRLKSNEITRYLSASDFALNPVKPIPSKRHCTSIKDGEYWSSGLPILITKNISDDSAIIEKEEIGSVIDNLSTEGIQEAIKKLDHILKQNRKPLRDKIANIAVESRSFDIADRVYKNIYSNGFFKVAYLCYWGIDDGLTTASALPTVNYLRSKKEIGEIDFYTIERATFSGKSVKQMSKIVHNPVDVGSGLIGKVLGIQLLWNKVKRNAREKKYDYIIARTGFVGYVGYKAKKAYAIPFAVESFEPHAEYMIESQAWSRYGIKSKAYNYYHSKQVNQADCILTVTDNYKEYLIDKLNIEENRIINLPCTVDIQQFEFNTESRIRIRKLLNIGRRTTGIYIGKFGGTYYDHESFKLFKQAYEHFKEDFFLIILSPNDRNEIVQKLKNEGIPEETYHIDFVAHEETPRFLSASDFAYATIKMSPSKLFCSPIKIGEYWANGLPVMLTEGVGDDSEIIEKEKCGALFNIENQDSIENCFETISGIIQQDNSRARISDLAKKYRSRDLIQKAYSRIL